MFRIKLGKPEVQDLWEKLIERIDQKKATKDDKRMAKRLGKAFGLLANDQRHPGLHSHDIDDLTARYGKKVWESYLENDTPAAGRIFWSYGPGRNEITIIAIEPHPNSSKSNAYDKITLSAMGESVKTE